jgi:hypothetical protein
MHHNVHLDVPSIFDTNFGGVCELLHQLHLSGYRATDICLAVGAVSLEVSPESRAPEENLLTQNPKHPTRSRSPLPYHWCSSRRLLRHLVLEPGPGVAGDTGAVL